MRYVCCMVLMTILFGCLPASSEGVRLCVSAGQLIPETKEDLQKAVQRYLNEATAAPVNEPLVACLVPHGPYGISGKVVAEAFKNIQPGQFKRVVILGASHADMAFEDCSIAAVDAYATPMGLVALDSKAIRKLSYSPLFASRSMRYAHLQRGFLTESERKPLHEYEHSIEIVLPFLQEKLGEFEIIPILIGNLTDGGGRYSEKRAGAIADKLRMLLDGETLFVVSTDLTHFGNDFSYRPFNSDILNKVEQLDKAILKRLETNDSAAFEDIVKRSQAPICGLNAIRVMLKLLPDKARGVQLGHTMSGRFYNDENRSVSYASMNFYVYAQPTPRIPLEPVKPKEDAESSASPTGQTPINLTNIGERKSE